MQRGEARGGSTSGQTENQVRGWAWAPTMGVMFRFAVFATPATGALTAASMRALAALAGQRR